MATHWREHVSTLYWRNYRSSGLINNCAISVPAIFIMCMGMLLESAGLFRMARNWHRFLQLWRNVESNLMRLDQRALIRARTYERNLKMWLIVVIMVTISKQIGVPFKIPFLYKNLFHLGNLGIFIFAALAINMRCMEANTFSNFIKLHFPEHSMTYPASVCVTIFLFWINMMNYFDNFVVEYFIVTICLSLKFLFRISNDNLQEVSLLLIR